jgi:hypothetical protein
MRVIGIMTKNFNFFYELVHLLRENREPFMVLDFEDSIPQNVGVIITTPEERGRVRFRKVVVNDQADMAVSVARSQLKGRETFQTLVAGIDPGSRPGLAIIGDGRVLVAETVPSPERVAEEIYRFGRNFRHSRLIARVGHGDRTNRNRIIRSIWNMVDDVEVVDETSTTRRTEEPDADAAVSIALGSGYRLPFPPEVRPTPGEVRDIQRLSRIESGGRVTISYDLAEAVARGEISLPEALVAQDRRSSR